MKQSALAATQFLSIAIEVMRGIGEFFSLQRWRLKQWLER